jgi:hypothetical protein
MSDTHFTSSGSSPGNVGGGFAFSGGSPGIGSGFSFSGNSPTNPLVLLSFSAPSGVLLLTSSLVPASPGDAFCTSGSSPTWQSIPPASGVVLSARSKQYSIRKNFHDWHECARRRNSSARPSPGRSGKGD